MGAELPEYAMDIDLITHYVATAAAFDFMDLIGSEFGRGYLAGRIVSLMENDLDKASEEEPADE